MHKDRLILLWPFLVCGSFASVMSTILIKSFQEGRFGLIVTNNPDVVDIAGEELFKFDEIYSMSIL